MDDSSLFIVGANGQLGTALREKYPNAKSADIEELDITDSASVNTFDWSGIKVLINAAAYTNVDGAETAEGRITAWKVNAGAVKNLAHIARKHNIILVHISTDYVFDGTNTPHSESEEFAPLSVYGASKAAGDLLVSQLDQYYILRTSWVIGEGKNFVRTMLDLAAKGINPAVVSDQIGRLTFTSELVRAIDHLFTTHSAFGTYNVSNDGAPASWADITRAIFSNAGLKNTVTDVTTAEYFKDKTDIAQRPLGSALDLGKLQSTGFKSQNWQDELVTYVKKEMAK